VFETENAAMSGKKSNGMGNIAEVPAAEKGTQPMFNFSI